MDSRIQKGERDETVVEEQFSSQVHERAVVARSSTCGSKEN